MASNNPVVVITGGNTGLGYEIIKALLAEPTGYEIILGSRSAAKGEEALKKAQSEVPNSKSSIHVLAIDVSSDESIEKAFEEVSSKYGRVDVLVNNAGANMDYEAQNGKYTLRQAFNGMWDVNVTGAHILSHTFMPLLLKTSTPRLIFMTSGTASLIETQETEKMPLARINAAPEAGWPKKDQSNPIVGYRSSKTGLNMLVTQWARVLRNDNVKVFAVSPGFLATGLANIGPEQLRKMGALEPHVGGEFVRDVIAGKHDHRTGKMIRRDADQPW